MSDPEKRKYYDAYGTAGGKSPFGGGGFQGGFPGGAGGAGGFGFDPNQGDFSDFFRTLFGSGGAAAGGMGGMGDPFGGGYGQSQRQAPQPPSRLDATIKVSLEEAYHGGQTTISVGGKRIDVGIPAGSRHGSKLRLKGQAPSGGDIYLKLELTPHTLYTLDGDNLRVTVDVPDYVAVLGGPVQVPTFEGPIEMNLPASTQSGRTLRLKGQGWFKKDGTRGDGYAKVRVVIPKTVTEEQRALYKQLQALNATEESETTEDTSSDATVDA